MIAAGAAFVDRVGEAFVDREMLRSEIMVLTGSSGLILIDLARLGAPLGETAGLHVALMGGLGLGVLAVFSIAGLLHTSAATTTGRGRARSRLSACRRRE